MDKAIFDKMMTSRLMGAYGVNNSNVIDRPYGLLTSHGFHLMRALKTWRNQVPYGVDPVPANIATAADIALLTAGLTVADRVAIVRYTPAALNGVLVKRLGVVGFLISQRFSNNMISSAFELQMRTYQQTFPGGVIYTELDRNIIVEPIGGANSVAEYLVLCVSPSQQVTYDNTAGVQAYTTQTSQNQGYALPC